MKVLTVIVSRGESWGAENAAVELSRELKRHIDVEVTLMGNSNRDRLYSGVPLKEFKSKKVPVIPKPYSNALLRTIITSQINKKYDLVHIQNLYPTIAMAQIAKKCIKQGVPYVVSTHGIFEAAEVSKTYSLNPVFKFLEKFIIAKPLRYSLSNANAIAALTVYEIPLLKSYGVKQNNIHVVYNGANPLLFNGNMELVNIREKYNIEKEIILFVGGVTARKGVDILVKAAPHLKDCKIVVVGEILQKGYYDYLQSLATSLNVENKVMFTGRVNERELLSFYHQSDIFVLPTRTDTLPLSIIDAMALKKPVISTKTGGIPEEVDSESGILVELDNHLMLADAINKLLSDKKLRENMGERGYQKVKENFTWEKVAQRTLGIYTDVITATKSYAAR